MTQTNDNIVMRDELQDAYINEIIDGMDLKDLIRIVYDNLEQNLASMQFAMNSASLVKEFSRKISSGLFVSLLVNLPSLVKSST